MRDVADHRVNGATVEVPFERWPVRCGRSLRLRGADRGRTARSLCRRGSRQMIYITNAVESLHRSCRKIIQTRSSCPTDEGPPKLLFPAIRTPGLDWRRLNKWPAGMGQFAIWFGNALRSQRAGTSLRRLTPLPTPPAHYPPYERSQETPDFSVHRHDRSWQALACGSDHGLQAVDRCRQPRHHNRRVPIETRQARILAVSPVRQRPAAGVETRGGVADGVSQHGEPVNRLTAVLARKWDLYNLIGAGIVLQSEFGPVAQFPALRSSRRRA